MGWMFFHNLRERLHYGGGNLFTTIHNPWIVPRAEALGMGVLFLGPRLQSGVLEKTPRVYSMMSFI